MYSMYLYKARVKKIILMHSKILKIDAFGNYKFKPTWRIIMRTVLARLHSSPVSKKFIHHAEWVAAACQSACERRCASPIDYQLIRRWISSKTEISWVDWSVIKSSSSSSSGGGSVVSWVDGRQQTARVSRRQTDTQSDSPSLYQVSK